MGYKHITQNDCFLQSNFKINFKHQIAVNYYKNVIVIKYLNDQ